MKILSIQVGLPKTLEFRGREITTGIFKDPIKGPVMVRSLNLEGDGQADLQVHGGPNKAVYAYGMDSFPAWKAKRPQDQFIPGAFGENLSVDHLIEAKIFVGDRFQAGQAILKAVQPRFPCYKLGVKFNDPSVLKDFMKMNRTGVYFSVEKEGSLQAGDELKLLDQEQTDISIARIFEIFQEHEKDPLEIKTILKIKSLPPELRHHFAQENR